jgi:ABC-2 type transport system permease protein
LLTLPVTVPQAVLGKYFAAWAFLGIALLLTVPMPAAVAYLGDPDEGLILTGYIGAFLMAGGFLAIGSFFSSVTKNQVISAILTAVACWVLVYAGMPTTLDYISVSISPAAAGIMENISLQTHFESVIRGMIAVRDVAYFVILIAAWIAACMLVLEERKAN